MLDPTTSAAYGAAVGAQARAEAVRDSLGSGTLTATVSNGETEHFAGTFAGPMIAGSDGSLSIDTSLSGNVLVSGTPNASTWMCRISNAGGRYVEGSFGPGGRFTWSEASMYAGQGARLNVRIEAPPVPPPAWRVGMAAWEWKELTGTALSSVEPAHNSTIWGITGPSSKITAWCGATLKRAGSVYMLGAAGGHGDYFGNEVNAIALSADSPAWTELRGYSAPATVYNAVEVYADDRRSSTHTYYGTQFLQAANRMLIMPAPGPGAEGALPAAPGGYAYPDGWNGLCAFSPATNDWLDPEHYDVWPGGGDFTAALAAANPLTDEVYYARTSDSGRLWKFSGGTWSVLTSNLWHQNYAGAAVDPTRNRMLIVGDYAGSMAPRIVDLSNGNVTTPTFGGLGGGALQMGGYPGVVYEEGLDEFLVIQNTNPITIYRVNAGTLSVSAASMTGTVPASRQNGVLSAIQYAPELGGLVFCNSYSGNLRFLATE